MIRTGNLFLQQRVFIFIFTITNRATAWSEQFKNTSASIPHPRFVSYGANYVDSEHYPNRKALVSRPLTAILALGQKIAHHTASVFHADQRGIGQFFLSGLGCQKRPYKGCSDLNKVFLVFIGQFCSNFVCW